jgi:very-short-patch-repair endonuclease
LEDLLAEQIRLMQLPAPERQAKLIPGRRFVHDFCWPRQKLAVEVQGGTWTLGAHSSGAGIERDCEKAALALLAGYRTLAVTGGQVRSGQALTWIHALLETTGEP